MPRTIFTSRSISWRTTGRPLSTFPGALTIELLAVPAVVVRPGQVEADHAVDAGTR